MTPFSGAGIGGLFSKFGQTGEKGFSEMKFDVSFLPANVSGSLFFLLIYCFSMFECLLRRVKNFLQLLSLSQLLS